MRGLAGGERNWKAHGGLKTQPLGKALFKVLRKQGSAGEVLTIAYAQTKRTIRAHLDVDGPHGVALRVTPATAPTTPSVSGEPTEQIPQPASRSDNSIR